VLDIARNTLISLNWGQELVEDDVVLVEDYAYPATAFPSEETKDSHSAVRPPRMA